MSDALPPRPDHVLPGLPRGQVGIALAVATGADIGGLWQEPVTAGPTYYICGTDPREIVKVRLANVLASDGGHPVPAQFKILLDDHHGIALFRRDRFGIASHRIFRDLEAMMTEQAPRLVVFEHFERYLNRAGLDWNDAPTRMAVLRILREAARRMNCAILIARHPWAEYDARPRHRTEADWDLWLAQDTPGAPMTLSYTDRRANAPIVRELVTGADGVVSARPERRPE
jgi:hypothetical protein